MEMASSRSNSEICGFIRYTLGDQPAITLASRGLMLFLGVLPDLKLETYEACIHPEDREKYRLFLQQAGESTGRRSICYRLQRQDGKSLWVTDRAISWKEPDGSIRGESTLTPISRKSEKPVPWGYLSCSCEKQPHIIRMNSTMREILRISRTPEGEADYAELYGQNVFLMLPMEERRHFSRYLQRISVENIPVFGEVSLIRSDGTRAHVFGWITRETGEDSREEFQAVCLDVSEYYQSRKELSTRRYLNALTDVYDKIFQYDLGEGILKCLYDTKESRFRWLRDVPMQMEKATAKWVNETVVPEQQKEVLDFFMAQCHKGRKNDAEPSRITYRARSSTGEIRTYSGIFLKIDNNTSLYCCRCLQDLQENDQLRTENHSLKENMQELMMRFSDGIAGFQIDDDNVTPLYVTDNICSFFGRTREEWLPMMKKATPIRDFVAQASVDYEKFEKLLQDGEAEFSYLDVKTHTQQRMKAICSHKTPCVGVPRYVMLYHVGSERERAVPHVYVRTFGYFDVFVDEVPIAFRNRKSKELLAFLVDRQGGFVSSEEAIGCLWEDEPVSPVTLARYRKVAMRLKNILMEYGISEILEVVDGKRRIIPQNMRCDLYDYLTGKEEYSQLFKGSYLTNYSWGESTLAELSGATPY